VFRDIAPATLDAVAGAMERLDLAPGTILVRQGDPAASLFLVLDGRLASAVRADDDPTEHELGTSGPGDVIGEVAVLTGTQRTATVRSTTPSVVAALAAEELWRLAADHPDLIDRLLATSVRRLRRGQFATYLATLLGPLDAGRLDAVEPRIGWTTLRGGEVLFRPDDPADALFVVLAGRLRVIQADEDQAATSSVDIGRGTPIGLTAVLTARPHRATVVAVRDTELARIDRPTLRWLTETYPVAGFALMERLAEQSDAAPTAPDRTQGGAATFALVGHRGVDAPTFARRLGATLAQHGRTLVVTAQDAATIGATAISRVPLHHWLQEREAAHDFVVYVTEAAPSPWTDQCLRQADHVLIVADATNDPAPDGLEGGLAGRWDAASAPRRTLLLLQPAGLAEPRGTARWLRPRSVDQHLHLRDGDDADLRRVGRLLAGQGISLVLGGGGARGYAHIGVIRAMERLGIPIDMVGGTSSGAIAGAAVARGWSADRMEQTMTRFGRRLLDPTLPLVSIASGGRLWRALDESFGDGLGIEDLWLPFFSVATDLTSASSVVHRTGPLARALRASLSLPGILPPVSMDGHLLIDGGLLDNLPIGVMRRLNGGSRIIAVDVSPTTDMFAPGELQHAISGWRVLAGRIRHPRTPPAVPGIVETLSRTVAVAGLRLEREQRGDAPDLLLQPPVAPFGSLDFANVKVIADVGYQPSLDALRGWWSSQPEHP
jgi:predicted acylesterase/phospholipase RssA/CRP-like cAMP-binding protein